MNHHATPAFWKAYGVLPYHIQALADKNFEKLKADLNHPSLHLKQAGRFWSVRVGISWRALAVRQDSDFIWFWIGSHAEYDRLLAKH